MLNKNIIVFICYAKEDKHYAKRLHDDLKHFGISPWLDTEQLLPGQRWEDAIEEAIEKSRFFIAILSKNSVNKTGVVQQELQKGISILKKHNEKDVFLIPVRIDDCQPTASELYKIHWVDLFLNWEDGLHKIIHMIDIYANSKTNASFSEDEKKKLLEFFFKSQQGEVYRKILFMLGIYDEMGTHQVSIRLETYEVLAKAKLELLRQKGILSRRVTDDATIYMLTEIGKEIFIELSSSWKEQSSFNIG